MNTKWFWEHRGVLLSLFSFCLENCYNMIQRNGFLCDTQKSLIIILDRRKGMKASFDVTLSPKDLYRFNMYQTYTGFQGWSSIALGILGFVMAGISFQNGKHLTPCSMQQ